MLFPRSVAVAIAFVCLAAGAIAQQIPRPVPDFSIRMTDRTLVKPSSYPGKVVVVAFLLTYCSHCQKTTGILSKLQNEYGPKGFQVLGSAIEDMAQLYVPDFMKKFQPAFPVGFNLRDEVENFLQHPSAFKLMMPQVPIIDRQGMIRAQYAGDDAIFQNDQEANLRAVIDPLLKAPVRRR